MQEKKGKSICRLEKKRQKAKMQEWDRLRNVRGECNFFWKKNSEKKMSLLNGITADIFMKFQTDLQKPYVGSYGLIFQDRNHNITLKYHIKGREKI